MKQLSLDNLRAFVTVKEQGGFVKAGELLGRSQPAISLQIKKLEQQLQTKLFQKEGQRQVLNQAGLQLFPLAKELLLKNDAIFQQFQKNQISGQVKLGIPSEFATTLLPSIIGEFKNLYPDVAIEVTSALSSKLLSPSEREDFDLILALQDIAEDKSSKQLTDKLVWAGPANSNNNFDNIQLVVAPEGCIYRKRMIEKLDAAGMQWQVSYSNADLFGIISAITEGLGITALSKRTLPNELVEINHPALPNLGSVDICLFKNENKVREASEELAQFVVKRLVA